MSRSSGSFSGSGLESRLCVWMMMILSSLLFIQSVHSTHIDDSYSPLDAHGGIFRELPWTKTELSMISSMHATAEYHSLMEIIKDKLVESGDELRPETRRHIEKFLKMKRPPPVMRHFLTEREKNQVRSLHEREDVEGVLDILREALSRLPIPFQKEALEYLSPPNAPDSL